MLLRIVRLSLWNRRLTATMTILTLTISLTLLLSIDHIRKQAKDSFTSSISGVDLIVGARSGQLNLLLYSVFRVGNPTNNISWETYQHIRQHPQISWTVPISLGDSHRGYRVIGTTSGYFEHFQYAGGRTLEFADGARFEGLFDVVLGAEVARALNYQVGDSLVISHGMGATSFVQHDNLPFVVSGILQPTGTPIDKSLHTSLEAIEAIHVGWQHGTPLPGRELDVATAAQQDLRPAKITAFLVGMNSRVASFVVQRQVNNYRDEPLSAILPGVALGELWRLLGSVERLLLLISSLVLFAAFAGLVTMLLASMKERQREIAILRAAGARPWQIFALIQIEVLVITFCSMLAALLTLSVSVAISADYLASRLSIVISELVLNKDLLPLLGAVLITATIVACVPAFAAYRQALTVTLSQHD